MRAAVLEARGQALRATEREDPQPGEDQVLLRVEACGVCHGDLSIADGDWDWVPLPRVIGHEVVGTVEAVGARVEEALIGRRVGVGWLYRSCGRCELCRTGSQMLCASRLVTGSDVDGGYATHLLAPASRVVEIPAELTSSEAAPLMCAGVSVFNGLRRAGLTAQSRVGVVGVGGLGHLAIQFARAAGSSVVAVSRSREKEKDALALGAEEFVSIDEGDLDGQLARLGGLDVAVVTGTDASVVSSLVGGMRPNGTLVVLGLENDVVISPVELCLRQLRVCGALTGTMDDEAEMLRFAAARGIRPSIEEFSLDEANVALARVRGGDVRYRAVLVP